MTKGRHQRTISAHLSALFMREWQAYRAWCLKHGWDHDNEDTAALYERRVGFLFIEAGEPGRHAG